MFLRYSSWDQLWVPKGQLSRSHSSKVSLMPVSSYSVTHYTLLTFTRWRDQILLNTRAWFLLHWCCYLLTYTAMNSLGYSGLRVAACLVVFQNDERWLRLKSWVVGLLCDVYTDSVLTGWPSFNEGWRQQNADDHSLIFFRHSVRSTDISFSWMYLFPVLSCTSSSHRLLDFLLCRFPSMLPSSTVNASYPTLIIIYYKIVHRVQ